MHPPRPNVLLVGNLPECEPLTNSQATESIATACVHLQRATRPAAECTEYFASWERVAGLPAALRHLSGRHQSGSHNLKPYDVVVLCEPRPGIWPDRDVAELRSLAPLARLVRLSGSLCEGQARSGRPAAGTWNVPWHRWPAFVERELSAAGASDSASSSSNPHWPSNPSWALPLTATPDERALAVYRPRVSRATGHVVICSASAAAAAALAATCRNAGYTTSQDPSVADAGERTTFDGVSNPAEPTPFSRQRNATMASPPNPAIPSQKDTITALLWDTCVESLRDAARVARLREAHDAVPILALAGFPRTEDVAAAHAAGITAVLAKPLDTAELLWQLEQLSAADRALERSGGASSS